jgi:hypothetical protein
LTWQFGRRNLAPFTRAELALKLEPLIADEAKKNLSAGGGDKKSDKAKSGCQNSDKAITPIDTKKEVAKLSGVSHDTIAKAKLINEHAREKTNS